MTDNDLRIKVAELLGWTRIGPGHDCVDGRQVDVLVGYTPKDDPDDRVTVIPDYPNDLNACQDIWRHLCTIPGSEGIDLRRKYHDRMERKAIDIPLFQGPLIAYVTANLPARQRCEAFVETMEAK